MIDLKGKRKDQVNIYLKNVPEVSSNRLWNNFPGEMGRDICSPKSTTQYRILSYIISVWEKNKEMGVLP